MTQVASPTTKSIGTVLVVGGCGFLGSATVSQLLNFPAETESLSNVQFPTLKSRYPNYSPTDTKVHVLDLKCNKNLFDGCTYHEADITSVQSLLSVFAKVKPDVVINTASPSFESPKAVLRKVNIEGTKTLVEVAGGKHGDWGGKCKVFVHTSSASVVSDAETDLKNADERWPYICPNPREYYSETKVYAEKIVLDYNNKEELGHMLTCCVRPAGIIGEGDAIGMIDGVLKTAQVAPSWQLHIQLGDGGNLFDLTYVHNVVYGLLCAADALLQTKARKDGGHADVLDTEKVDGEAFIVTNDEPIFFWDATRFLYSSYGRAIDRTNVWAFPEGFVAIIGGFSELFGAVTGRKSRFTRQTAKYGCISRYFSCDKIKRRTGYRPIVGVDEGLSRGVAWFKDVEAQERSKKGQ